MYDPSKIKIVKNRYLDRDYYIGDSYNAIINASIGTSLENDKFELEANKAQIAIRAGASMITDHSICGDIKKWHHELRENVHVPIGAVPIYELALHNPRFSDKEALEIIEEYLERGFNILTLHSSVLKQDLENEITKGRIIPMTSKGGKAMLTRMMLTGSENPFYTQFDEILNIFKKYDAVISLGPTYRPGSVVDNSDKEDDAYWIEINRMSRLVKKAIKYQVPIIVEGIGHARMDMIPFFVRNSKKICCQVPYRVMTVSTDIALGYDNVSSAIASSISVLNGANIVTAVTPSEHIGLPSSKDVEEGVVAAKIAIHSAEICIKDDITHDIKMSEERSRRKVCQGSIREAIFPQGVQEKLKDNDMLEGCSMCGSMCTFIYRDKE